MRHQLSSWVDSSITALLLVVVGMTPLLFFNQTTEYFEIPKLIFLVVMVLLLVGLWALSWVLKGTITITRTPLDIPLVLLLIGVVISAVVSESRYPAIFGTFPKVHGSAISWVAYILLYFVTVSHLKELAQIRALLYVFFASSIVVAVITVLSFFNILLPLEVVTGVNFTPTGSAFSTVALLLLLLPIAVFSIINPNKYFPVPVALIIATLFGVTVVLIGSVTQVILLFIVFVVCYIVSRPHHVKKTVALLLIPVGVVGLVVTFIYFPPPGSLAFLQQAHTNYPTEVQLPVDTSWKVSASAFRDKPLLGSGPSTYLFNFTRYKPLEFNQLAFWNVSFDSAYNEFLQIFGTLGIVGIVGVLLLTAAVIRTSVKNFIHTSAALHGGFSTTISSALAISGLVGIGLFAIHAATLVSMVTTLMICAALMASQKSIRDNIVGYSLGLRASASGNRQFDVLPYVVFVLVVAGLIYMGIKMPSVVMADYHHRLALNQAQKNASLTYEYLQKAESLNPHIDLYRVDMAQTNFALANAIATRTGSNNGATTSASLTESDKQTIQTLISQSINEAKASVTLSPLSARNWEVLGAIYRNITGVAENALTYSLDAYGRAIQLDPLNPTLRLNVGGIYYSMKNYDTAIRFFSDAANLKPDYASAYYQLSVTLRDKGDVTNAKIVAQRAVSLLQKNSTDYVIAANLLKELESSLATGSAEPATSAPKEIPAVNPLDNITLPAIDTGAAPNTNPQPTTVPVLDNPEAGLPELSVTPPADTNQ